MSFYCPTSPSASIVTVGRNPETRYNFLYFSLTVKRKDCSDSEVKEFDVTTYFKLLLISLCFCLIDGEVELIDSFMSSCHCGF